MTKKYYLVWNNLLFKYVVVDKDDFPYGQGDTKKVALQSARNKLGDFQYDDNTYCED